MTDKLFCFSAGHSDTHPYLVWTDDLLVASPTWHVNNNGLPDRWIPAGYPGNAEANSIWAVDPNAPMDRFYGTVYSGATGDSMSIVRNDDVRNGAAWQTLLDLASFKTLISNATYTAIRVGALYTSPDMPAGFVMVGLTAGTGATGAFSPVSGYALHSHDYGATWTAVVIAPGAGGGTYTRPGTGGIAANGALYLMCYNAGGNHYLHVSTDGGHTWSRIGTAIYTLAGLAVMNLPRLASADGATIYLGMSGSGVTNAGVWKTTDKGTTWVHNRNAATTYLDTGVTSCPGGESEVLATWGIAADNFFYTIDAAASWVTVANMPASSHVAMIRPITRDTWLVGSGYTRLGQTATSWVYTWDTSAGWVNRDGNLAAIFGSDSAKARFCNIVSASPMRVGSAAITLDAVTVTALGAVGVAGQAAMPVVRARKMRLGLGIGI
jgi:hypothetical protein